MMEKETKFKQTEIGMIPEDWEVKKIKDIGNVITGKTPSTIVKEYFSLDFPFIKIPDLGKSVYVDATEEMLSKKGAELMSSLRLPKDSVMFLCLATIGKVGITKTDSFTNQQINSVVPDKRKVTPLWIYYFLKNNISYLESLGGGGSVYTNISKSKFENALVVFPKIDEQERIAKILFSLDSKIELNQTMNKTLEAIGQAIFKHWFVDFEFPNEEGKPYKSSDGEMVYNEELRKEIPKGWRVGRLGDYGTFKNGINYLRNETGDTDFFIVNVRDIANNKLLLKESLDKINIDFKKAKEYLLNDKDILIARSASPGEVSLVLGNLEKVIYSGFSIRYRLNNSNNFLYFFLILQGLKENLLNFSIGTTLQSVNQETLKNMKFILPSNDILKEFNKAIEKIFDKTYNNLIQIQTLSQIRDSLLPKLISGKIRIPLEDKDND